MLKKHPGLSAKEFWKSKIIFSYLIQDHILQFNPRVSISLAINIYIYIVISNSTVKNCDFSETILFITAITTGHLIFGDNHIKLYNEYNSLQMFSTCIHIETVITLPLAPLYRISWPCLSFFINVNDFHTKTMPAWRCLNEKLSFRFVESSGSCYSFLNI